MSSENITPQQILAAVQQLPEDRWYEVLPAIERLQTKTQTFPPALSPVRTGADLSDSELIGLWADRFDSENGHEFARELRRNAEQRK